MKNINLYSDSDIAIYKNNLQRLHESYEKFYELVNFPLFRFSNNTEMAKLYLDDLQEMYSDEKRQDIDSFLVAEYKPLAIFAKKHKEHIRTAQKYYNKSNGKHLEALKIYSVENPDIKIGDDEIYLPYLSAW